MPEETVPADRLRPLVEWLVNVYGSQRILASIIHLDHTTVGAIIAGRVQSVKVSTAVRITDLVLTHRRGYSDPLGADRDGPRRLATQRERDAHRREVASAWRQYYRDRQAGNPCRPPTETIYWEGENA